MQKNTPASNDTTPPSGHKKIYIVSLVLALLVFGAAAYGAKKGLLLRWEEYLLMAINGLSATWYRTATVVTLLGSSWMVVAAVVSTYVVKLYRLTWRLSLATLLAYGTGFAAKALIARPRPEQLFDGIHVYVREVGMGYPSLHTTIATVVMLVCLPYLPGKWRAVVPIVILLVGFSRMYLGVHSPLDIVGGVALGTIVVSLLRILPARLASVLRLA